MTDTKNHSIGPDLAFRQAILAFWKAFSLDAQTLRKTTIREVFDAANRLFEKHTKDKAKGIVIEISGKGGTPSNLGDFTIIFSSNGDVNNFPKIRLTAKLFPSIDGYTCTALREPLSEESANEFSLSMDGIDVSLASISGQMVADSGRVGLFLKMDATLKGDEKQLRHIAFIILGHVFGEWDFAVKIGFVEFLKSDDSFDDANGEVLSLLQIRKSFHTFWTEELKHTGIFPSQESEENLLQGYCEGTDENDEPDVTTRISVGANAMVCSQEFPYVLKIKGCFDDNKLLEKIKQFEGDFEKVFGSAKTGFFAYRMLRLGDDSWEHVCYVNNADFAIAEGTRILKKAFEAKGGFFSKKTPTPELTVQFDPVWSDYLQFPQRD